MALTASGTEFDSTETPDSTTVNSSWAHSHRLSVTGRYTLKWRQHATPKLVPLTLWLNIRSFHSCAGFNVGVNTDNRLMSDVSPSSELVALHHAHQLSWADIERLVTNAISSGFAPLTERQHIINNIVAPAYSSLANG